MKIIVLIFHNSSHYDHSTLALFCRYHGFFSIALSFSSNMTSCAIAVNRFIAIVYTQKYYAVQRLPVLLIMILIPWIIPPAVSSLGLADRYGEESFHMSELGFCTFNLDLRNTANQNWKFMIAMAVPCLFIPTVIIAGSYLAIYIKVWRVRRNLRRSAYSPVIILSDKELSTVGCSTRQPNVICLRMKRFEHRVRGARMMFVCFTAFCVTYYPAPIAVIVARHMRSRILLEKPPLLLWFFGLFFTGCCVNPVSVPERAVSD